MKLQPAVGDQYRTETRLRGREPAPTEGSGRGAAFDHVLTGVEAKPSQLAPANQAAASSALGARRSNKSASAGGDSPDEACAQTASSGHAKDDSTETTVGSLLKRIKSKDEAADPQALAPTTLASADTLLAAPLVLDLRMATAGAGGKAGPETHGVASPNGQLASALSPDAQRTPGAALQQENTGILGISLETHITPTDRCGLTAMAADDAGAASTDGPAHADASSQPIGPIQVEAKVSVQPTSSTADEAGDGAAVTQGRPADIASTTAVAAEGGGAAHHGASKDDGQSDPPLPKAVDPPVATTGSTVAPQHAIRSIATAVVDLAAQSPLAAPAEAPAAHTAMARTVTLQMSPADLGTVEVRLHMSGHTLDLHLTISERETVGLVTRERDTLAAALQGQGYDLHSLVIQDGAGAPSSGGPNVANQQSSGDTRSERHGGNEGGGGPAGGRDQDNGRQARGGSQSGSQEPLRARVSDRSSLFV